MRGTADKSDYSRRLVNTQTGHIPGHRPRASTRAVGPMSAETRPFSSALTDADGGGAASGVLRRRVSGCGKLEDLRYPSGAWKALLLTLVAEGPRRLVPEGIVHASVVFGTANGGTGDTRPHLRGRTRDSNRRRWSRSGGGSLLRPHLLLANELTYRGAGR